MSPLLGLTVAWVLLIVCGRILRSLDITPPPPPQVGPGAYLRLVALAFVFGWLAHASWNLIVTHSR